MSDVLLMILGLAILAKMNNGASAPQSYAMPPARLPSSGGALYTDPYSGATYLVPRTSATNIVYDQNGQAYYSPADLRNLWL